MSWVRWGSRCDFTFPIGIYQCDVDCAAKGCPGSDLYIYESDENVFNCCCCRLHPDGEDYVAHSEQQMENHIMEHIAAGHHTRQSLRKDTAKTIAAAYKGTMFDPATWPVESESEEHDK